MSTLSPDRWKAASPYLDQALEMPVEALAGWLEALRRQDPSLASDVEALLAEPDGPLASRVLGIEKRILGA